MSTDALQCMEEVFLEIFKFLPKLGQTGKALYVHSSLLKTQLRK
jgi:hypothetical protein